MNAAQPAGVSMPLASTWNFPLNKAVGRARLGRDTFSEGRK
jgi:hypothetical protein